MSISSIGNSAWALASLYSNQNSSSKITSSDDSTSTSQNSSYYLEGVTSSNSDGDTFQVSSAAQAMLSDSEMFSQMDTDGDGSVTEEEFLSAHPDDVTEEMATTDCAEIAIFSSGYLSK